MKRRKRIETLICFLLLLSSLLYLIHTIDQLSAKRRESAVFPLVSAASAEFDVPVAMILAVIRTESNFQSKAISRAGAVGLMQLMPSTFEWLTDDILREYLGIGMLYDPETNIKYGTYYLSRLYNRFGDWDTAIAAYNGGEGNVSEWLNDKRYSDDGIKLKTDKIPDSYSETKNYVKKVNKALEKYKKLYNTEK